MEQERRIGVVEPARGEALAVCAPLLTAAQYGLVNILAVWEAAYETPLYLVTNLLDLTAALALYRNRAHLETFFSDQKSRGIHIRKRHLRDPERLTRLLIASCLAPLCLVYLGVCALCLLAHCLKDDMISLAQLASWSPYTCRASRSVNSWHR